MNRETWIALDNLTPRQRVTLFRLFEIVKTQNNCERVYVAEVEIAPPLPAPKRIEEEFPHRLPNRGGNRPR